MAAGGQNFETFALHRGPYRADLVSGATRKPPRAAK